MFLTLESRVEINNHRDFSLFLQVGYSVESRCSVLSYERLFYDKVSSPRLLFSLSSSIAPDLNRKYMEIRLCIEGAHEEEEKALSFDIWVQSNSRRDAAASEINETKTIFQMQILIFISSTYFVYKNLSLTTKI